MVICFGLLCLLAFSKMVNCVSPKLLTVFLPKGAKDEVKRLKGPPARRGTWRSPRLLVYLFGQKSLLQMYYTCFHVPAHSDHTQRTLREHPENTQRTLKETSQNTRENTI